MIVKFKIVELTEIWVDEELITAFSDWAQEFDTEQAAINFISEAQAGNEHRDTREVVIQKVFRI